MLTRILQHAALLFFVSLPYAVKASSVDSNEVAFILGQKQILDIRYFCEDGTSADKCITPVTQLPEVLEKLIVENRIGGIILFADNIESTDQVRALNERLQHIVKQAGLPPLFIAIDQEGGRVARLPAEQSNTFAGNMAIGATYAEHSTDYAVRVNSTIAKQISALGFNVNFAPTVDVNVNPENPVINVRSYGESPKIVADLGIAAVKALQSEGVISAMKHFPGHGDTHVDSHTGLPLVEHDEKQIFAIDLYPFAKAIAAGGLNSPKMIMTAHIQYPNLDDSLFVAKDGNATILPATLSRKILTSLLRERLEYEGLIVTDAMDMAGIAHYMEPPEAIMQTFYAGADIALMPFVIRNTENIQTYQKVMSAMVDTVMTSDKKTEDSNLKVPSIEMLRQSAARISAVKAEFLVGKQAQSPLTKNDQLEKQLSRDALTVVKGSAQISLDRQTRIGLAMPDAARCLAMRNALEQKGFKSLNCINFAVEQSKQTLTEFAEKHDAIIVADISPQHTYLELGGMDDWRQRVSKQQQLSNTEFLLRQASGAHKRTVLIAMRAPYVIEKFADSLDFAVATYDYRVFTDLENSKNHIARGVAFETLAEWFSGEFPAKGTLPVTVGSAEVAAH